MLKLLWIWKIDFFYQMTFLPPNKNVTYNHSPYLIIPPNFRIMPEKFKKTKKHKLGHNITSGNKIIHSVVPKYEFKPLRTNRFPELCFLVYSCSLHCVK